MSPGCRRQCGSSRPLMSGEASSLGSGLFFICIVSLRDVCSFWLTCYSIPITVCRESGFCRSLWLKAPPGRVLPPSRQPTRRLLRGTYRVALDAVTCSGRQIITIRYRAGCRRASCDAGWDDNRDAVTTRFPICPRDSLALTTARVAQYQELFLDESLELLRLSATAVRATRSSRLGRKMVSTNRGRYQAM